MFSDQWSLKSKDSEMSSNAISEHRELWTPIAVDRGLVLMNGATALQFQ